MIRFSTADNFSRRSVTAIVLAAVILTLVSWNVYSFVFLLCAINTLSLNEFYKLFRSASLTPRAMAGLILSNTIIITFFIVIAENYNNKLLLICIPVAYFILLAELYRRSANPFQNLAFTFSGIVYITIPLIFFLGIGLLPFDSGRYNSETLRGYFFILWASDTGAYLVGRKLGSHPLFKRISPKKTWEGSIGGVFFALIVSFLNSVFIKGLTRESWLILAFIIVIAGTFGDLIKSMMKRSLKIKDSGTLLPGHGGMLDRFDSMFGSAPIAFCYLIAFSRHE